MIQRDEEGLLKFPARAASTSNIDLSTGGLLTIDGVSLNTGDRVLVKDQTDLTQNGIYVVNTNVWARATDANQTNELLPGVEIFIEEGNLYAGTGWLLKNESHIVVGTSNIQFEQFNRIPSFNSKIDKVANINTEGNFGVSTVLASCSDVQIEYNASTPSTPIDFTVLSTPVTFSGNYLIYVYYRVQNSQDTIEIQIKYSDSAGQQTLTVFNGLQNTGSFNNYPIFINAVENSSIQIIASSQNANLFVSSSIIGL